MAKPPAKFKPISPRDVQREQLDTLLRELFQLSTRGAPESELKAQISRLETEYKRLEQVTD